MKRPIPPAELTEGFHEAALSSYRHGHECDSDHPMRLYDGGPACWLWQLDPLERPCSGRLEAFHFIGRQRIRNTLQPQLSTAPFANGANRSPRRRRPGAACRMGLAQRRPRLHRPSPPL